MKEKINFIRDSHFINPEAELESTILWQDLEYYCWLEEEFS